MRCPILAILLVSTAARAAGPAIPAAATASLDLRLVRGNDPIVAGLVAAAHAAAGEPVVLMPTLGGSLPLYHFIRTWKRPIVIVPIANHDDNQHAANENLRLANLWYGIDLFAAIFAMP